MFRLESVPPESFDGGLHIVFQGTELVLSLRSTQSCLFADEDIRGMQWAVARRQFLGFWHNEPCYALEIAEDIELDPMAYQKGSLYQILGRVDDQLFAMVGRAAQLLDWERDHQHCGRCGETMVVDPIERAMCCAPCKIVLYPRIAPCIIVLVTRGEEMLLARSPNFPVPMYSTLAGFIEAGESVEQTLIREVREEVAIDVHNLQYFKSQAWPFPNQLMLGFFAEYAGGDIICDPKEIADAQWFHYTNLPKIPPTASISGQLIAHYVNQLS